FADIFNSGCFYFAAMVLTLRKARWFGSRLLPLGWALVCSVVVTLSVAFWQAFLVSLLGMIVGAIAAWSAFATSGTTDRGWLPRLALGLMVFAGALAIGLVFQNGIGVLNTDAAWSGVRLDRDGNVLRVSWTLTDNERHCVIADANGNRL